MAKRKIIWSHRARIKLYEILEYFAERDNNTTYAERLYKRFIKELHLLKKHPDLGIKTEIDSVRGLIISDYIIFYEDAGDDIVIHTVWDSRQNPDDLKIK